LGSLLLRALPRLLENVGGKFLPDARRLQGRVKRARRGAVRGNLSGMMRKLLILGATSLAMGTGTRLTVAEPKGEEKAKPYRLKAVDIKRPVLWGAGVEYGKRSVIQFGGQDQTAPDGAGHTQANVFGGSNITPEDLRRRNRDQRLYEALAPVIPMIKAAAARARMLYLDDMAGGDRASVLDGHVARQLRFTRREVADAVDLMERLAALHEIRIALRAATDPVDRAFAALIGDIDPGNVAALDASRIGLEQFLESLGAEPPPRALSPLVYDPKQDRIILFGGDHFDYLTNDTWVFEAGLGWALTRPKTAPPPRANHTLRERRRHGHADRRVHLLEQHRVHERPIRRPRRRRLDVRHCEEHVDARDRAGRFAADSQLPHRRIPP
jgi:hypothetical protein